MHHRMLGIDRRLVDMDTEGGDMDNDQVNNSHILIYMDIAIVGMDHIHV